jgi:hypothetical protein
MDLAQLLRETAGTLVEEAAAQVHQARLQHYEEEGVPAARERLSTLLDLTLECLEASRAEPIIEWATRIGRERYERGYELAEVQTAINVLEEILWRRILATLGPGDLAYALGLVNALLGMAKDTVARTYVSLATRREEPAVRLEPLLRERAKA